MNFSDLITKLSNEIMPNFDNEIDIRLAQFQDDVLYEKVKYGLMNGKRIRPLITILVNRGLGANKDPVDAAIAIELMHSLSLIHDDVIDREITRRGSVPFYIKYGFENTLLIADYIFGIIIKIISKYNKPEILRTLSYASVEMSRGEAKELYLTNNPRRIDLNEYLQIINEKTASLFAASAKIGALLSKKPELKNDMEDLGKNFGIIYQIKDDLKDVENGRTEIIKFLQTDPNKLTYLISSFEQAAEREIGHIINKEVQTLLTELLTTLREY
jgi:octaprenyl-diphosphate synthase